MSPAPWEHDHTLGQDQVRPGERRTLVVAALTAVFMVVEITAGVTFGSMALLADGLHMGSHAVALGIAVSAYVYARRCARDERFSFGTGKVNALGGFTGALLLAIFAAFMAWESAERFLHPVAIVFDQAIVVAVVGLVVNGFSALLLGHEHDEHEHDEHDEHEHEHGHDDHNLRAARLHVLADALTSVLALVALLGGKYLEQVWLDPAMGIVGAILVARWSIGLLRQSSGVLLDHQAPAEARARLRAALEKDDARVVDLHLWSIGPGLRAASVTLVAREPLSPADYKARVPADLGIGHVTVELHREPS